MTERVAFASLFESLERILGRALDATTVAKLRALGMDFTRRKPPSPSTPGADRQRTWRRGPGFSL